MAAFPAVSLGTFYWITIENIKIKAPRFNHGDYHAKIKLSNNFREEIH